MKVCTNCNCDGSGKWALVVCCGNKGCFVQGGGLEGLENRFDLRNSCTGIYGYVKDALCGT